MPDFLTLAEVIEIHQQVLLTHGGSPGIRDRGLLESALAQPGLAVFGQPIYPNVFSQAAAYLYHLTANHGFIDGNKRTAWVCALVWLDLHGYSLTMSQDERFDLVISVANGELDKSAIMQILVEKSMSRCEL